ncbi:glycine-rich domain-containing protein [Komagataeibacter sp. NFXK3]
MDRQIVYPAQIPLDSDLLNAQRNAFVSLGHLAGMAYGDNTVAAGGFVCTPGTGLAVTIAPGSLLAAGVVDGTAYGTLAANGSVLVRQYISRDPVTLAVPGAGATYTVYVTPATVDADATVLPFYNAADPSVTYAGADNSGKAAPTVRQDVAQLGIAATVPDGACPLWTITVPAAATAMTADMIAQAEGAPFYQTIPELQASKISKAGDGMTGPLTVLNAAAAQNPVALGQLAGLTPGRLLNTQVFDTAGTYPYTPTPGTTRIEVDIQGGGGSGGYTYGTGSAYVSCSTAGGAGSFCRAAYALNDIQDAIAAGINITVGAAGAVSPLNESGGNGGASSFGSLATAPGGYGGKYGVAANENAYFQFALGTPGDAPTGTGIIFSVRGGPADMQFDLGGGIMSGQGGSSLFGTGGGPISAGGAYGVANVIAQNGNGPGAGGSGLPAGVSATGGPGGLGVDGIVIIREYA